MKTIIKLITSLAAALSMLTALTMPLYAQESDSAPRASYLFSDGIVAPESPEAAAVARYGDVADCNLNTGEVGFSIPVYTYSDNDFNIPIALSYSSNGYRPNVQSGVMGLGWYPSTGWSVTREVRGIMDDAWPDLELYHFDNKYNFIQQEERPDVSVYGYGFVHHPQSVPNPVIPSIAGSPISEDLVLQSKAGAEYMPVLWYNDGHLNRQTCFEKEPDVYSFNAPGGVSGKFILRPDGGASFFDTAGPESAFTVSVDLERSGFTRFVITDADGYVYTYAEADSNESWSLRGDNDDVTSYGSWRLSSVEAPSGRKILFTYGIGSSSLSVMPSKTIESNYRITYEEHNPHQGHYGDSSEHEYGGTWEDMNYSRTHSACLTGISVRNADGTEVCGMSFSYTPKARERGVMVESCGCHKLSGITVRNSLGRTVKTCTLDYMMDYAAGRASDGYDPDDSGVTFLKSVRISGEGRYSFEYRDRASTTFPALGTWGTDWYGYWAPSVTSASSFAPQTLTHCRQNISTSPWLTSLRQPDPTSARKGMLERVSYPTGGWSTFSYEANSYSRDKSCMCSQSPLRSGTASGVRIARISAFDSNGTEVQRRDFSYVGTDGVTSSGELIWRPSIYTQYHMSNNQYHTIEREVMSTANDYPYSGGDFLGYLRVLETVYAPGSPSDRSITEYVFSPAETGPFTTFSNPIDYLDQSTFCVYDLIWHCSISSNLPTASLYAGLTNCQQGAMKGRLTSRTEYAGSLSCPVTRTGYYYEDYGDIEYIDFRTMRMGFGTTERLFYRGVRPKRQTVVSFGSRDRSSVIPVSDDTVFYDDLHRVSRIRRRSGTGGWLDSFYEYCEDAPTRLFRQSVYRDSCLVSASMYSYLRPDVSGHPRWLVPRSAEEAVVDSPWPMHGDLLNDIEYRTRVTLGGYDAAGNPHSVTDAAGNVTRWEWGTQYAMMHPTRRTFRPAGQSGPSLVTQWEWIPLVGPSSETGPSGKTLGYTYDAEGRLTGKSENGVPLLRYDYCMATEEDVELPPIWAPEFGSPEEGSATVPSSSCTYAVELTSCNDLDVDYDSVLDGIYCQLAENGGGSWISMQRYAHRSPGHITLYVDFAENTGKARSLRLGTESCNLTITQNAVDSLLLEPGNWTMVTRYGNGHQDGSVRVHDVTHYDGLGCAVQETAVLAADGIRDIVTPRIHDAMFREVNVPLPFPAESRGGRMQDIDGEQLAWYNDIYGTDEGSCARYRKVMECCPSGRTLEGRLPGYEMADNPSENTYLTNSQQDAVRMLSADPVTGSLVVGGTYAPGTLSGVRSVDGDGRTVTIWTDREGRTVREDRELSATETASTLYAYDWRGNLTWVIQPEGVQHLDAITSVDCEAASKWCFVYRHDGLGRVMERRIPGKGPETFTYDDLDRVVTSQDALQESRGEHVSYTYDALGREISREVVKKVFFPAIGRRITVHISLLGSSYDSYPSSADAVPVADGVYVAGTALSSPAGLLTEERLALLDSGSPADAANGVAYVTRTYWYDSRERVAQSLESRPDGSSIRTSFLYDLQGNVLKRKETVTEPEDANPRSLLSEYTYDARGRVLTLARTLGNGDSGTSLDTVEYGYDELGHLCSKTVGSKLAETYTYDMRGWAKDIEAKRGTDLLFSESLRYDSPQTPGSVNQYSGNISEIETVQYGNPKDIYAYSYDGLSRLTDARHFIGGPAGASNTNTERLMEYDRNGNLTSLQRYGGSPSDCSTLLFGYTGNRLTGVTKIIPRIISGYNYAYDLNGNRTLDSRTGLEFTYNLLNLPCEVRDSQDNMKMRYTYLSDGTKVSALDAEGDGLLYRGSFVYDRHGSNVNLESVAWDEGRIVSSANPPLQDQWFVKDHLGNVRSVINLSKDSDAPVSDVILEQNDYLPYGTKVTDVSLPALSGNRYRYAGKEEQRFGTFDSQLLDFGARYYDPWSCQWTAVDPMGEKYAGMSPYVYCAGNPILLADPNGASPKDKKIAVGIGILTNIVPNSGFLRDKYSPDDKAEYNENLQKVDNACLVAGFALAGKGVADLSVGSAVAATGFAVATTGVGTVAGAGMIVEGGAVDAKGLAEVAVGTTMAMNAAENAGKGYNRGKDGSQNSSERKFSGSGKNEPHGNNAAIEKMDKRNESLKTKLIGATKKERERIKKTMQNNTRNGQKKAKGETHHR